MLSAEFLFFPVLHNSIYICVFIQTPPKDSMRALFFHVFVINWYHNFSSSWKENSLTVLWHFILHFLECGLWLLSYCLHELSASNQGLKLFSNRILLHYCNLAVCIVSFRFIIWCTGNFTPYFLTLMLTFLGICRCWLGIWVDRGSCG